MVVVVDVVVSCAAIIRKIMWLTMSVSVKASPSSVSAWHSAVNMSAPDSFWRAMLTRSAKYSSSSLRPCKPCHHLNGGRPKRKIAPPARVVATNALLTFSSRSCCECGSLPMNTTDATSRVSSLMAG
ncbi:Uncharacterised protein [Mycobacteroides abscessus subsp. massiliense]|nr:Uncharacterised protein [Mycobacteroides abscessus subsp. massiliense]